MNESLRLRLSLGVVATACLAVATGCYGWAHFLSFVNSSDYESRGLILFSRIASVVLLTALIGLAIVQRSFSRENPSTQSDK